MPLVPEFLAGRTPPDLYHQFLMPAFEPWASDLFERARPTGNVLDIACGTGLLSRKAADSEDVTSVQAIDVAEPMIEKARSLSEAHSARITYSIASALDLPFEEGVFNVAYCQQGLQFFPDRLLALSEAKRVLKPGGKAAFSSWTAASNGNPVFAALEEIVAGEIGDDLIPFGPFAFGDRDKIGQLAQQAGLEIETLITQSLKSPLPDIRTFILFDLAFLGRPAPDGSLQPILDFNDPASDEVIERVIARMEEATAEFQQSDGSILAPMTANILVARA